jgi:hypothetical protein
MKKYLLLTLMAGGMLLACNKVRTENADIPKGMEFRASASATKSHFESDEPGNTNLQLYWDAYDNLAVYSVDPDDPLASIVSGTAYIQPDGVGQTSALFRSYIQESEWFKNAATDGTKHFFAYYPAPAPNDLEEENGELVMPVYLQSDQYKGKFGDYQLMVAGGKTYNPGERVEFDDFTPVTSLLKFQLKMDQPLDFSVTSITIEPYIYTYYREEADGNGYHSDIVVGKTVDPETLEEFERFEYAERLVGTRYIKLSSLMSDGSIQWGRYDYSAQLDESHSRYYGGYFPYEWSTLYVHSDYNEDAQDNLNLNGEPSDVMYAVVFPTTSYPSRGEYALGISARCDVRSQNEDNGYSYSIEHRGYIRIPRPGFEAGKRYDFVLTLTQDGLKIMQSNGEIDLSYEVVNW